MTWDLVRMDLCCCGVEDWKNVTQFEDVQCQLLALEVLLRIEELLL